MTQHIERIPLPVEAEWTSEQRQVVTEISAGPRGGLIGPFRPLLHSPGLMDRIQKTGEYIRWYSEMPDPIREMVILMAARRWDQEFEWRYHRPIAESCGLPTSVIADIAQGLEPSDLDKETHAVWALADEVLRTGNASDACVAHAIDVLGHRHVVEYVATIGYYTNLAFVMNVANTEPPEGPGLPPRLESP